MLRSRGQDWFMRGKTWESDSLSRCMVFLDTRHSCRAPGWPGSTEILTGVPLHAH